MIQTLLSGKKTVAGVLAAFNKTPKDLKRVEEGHTAEAAMAREVQDKLTSVIAPSANYGVESLAGSEGAH